MGLYLFRISGGLSHWIGSLLPEPGQQSAYAQHFVSGDLGREDIELRALRSGADLDLSTLEVILRLFFQINPYAQVFKNAREILLESETRTVQIRTLGNRDRDPHRYNFPTTSEIAVIVDGDGEIGAKKRDIILHRRDGRLQRVSELHTGYFAMRYPIVFPYGSQGWDENYRESTDRRK